MRAQETSTDFLTFRHSQSIPVDEMFSRRHQIFFNYFKIKQIFTKTKKSDPVHFSVALRATAPQVFPKPPSLGR